MEVMPSKSFANVLEPKGSGCEVMEGEPVALVQVSSLQRRAIDRTISYPHPETRCPMSRENECEKASSMDGVATIHPNRCSAVVPVC